MAKAKGKAVRRKSSKGDPVLNEIYRRSATDPDFHALCLRDPRAAFAEVCGEEMPPDFKPRFVARKSSDEFVVVLPLCPAKDTRTAVANFRAKTWPVSTLGLCCPG